jgi:hypothetical protein
VFSTDVERDRNGRAYVRGRLNVEAQVRHSADGEATPILILHGKQAFHVFSSRKIKEETEPGNRKLETYRVRINGKDTCVYCEDGVWFVEEKRYIDEMRF